MFCTELKGICLIEGTWISMQVCIMMQVFKYVIWKLSQINKIIVYCNNFLWQFIVLQNVWCWQGYAVWNLYMFQPEYLMPILSNWSYARHRRFHHDFYHGSRPIQNRVRNIPACCVETLQPASWFWDGGKPIL